MTEQERIQLMNENYEHDRMELAKSEMKFGNMNYYLKKAEYLKKHCWKTAEDVRADIYNRSDEKTNQWITYGRRNNNKKKSYNINQ